MNEEEAVGEVRNIINLSACQMERIIRIRVTGKTHLMHYHKNRYPAWLRQRQQLQKRRKQLILEREKQLNPQMMMKEEKPLLRHNGAIA